MSQSINPCCVPARVRLEQLELSRRISAERPRVTSGPAEGMVSLPGGRFLMGTDYEGGFSADGEGPVREVVLDPFWIDRTAVTVTQFADFQASTGYRTEAENFGWSFCFRSSAASQHVMGVPWWGKVDGVTWRDAVAPNHPVVHVSWNDAAAYAAWAGKRLPTEAEWEYAARGGLEQKLYVWGDELTPGGRHMANIWQGVFPTENTAEDGYLTTAPADAFPANGYGLHNMAGNTWEWCADRFDPVWHVLATRANPIGPPTGTSRAMRGGSFLCHHSYCNRYRVAARTKNTPESSAENIGFRCVRDVA